ncbi:MAG: 4Fe-4S ferredoxin [Spirochaetae bacterium HGW-Spirochaetae-1]|jgi:NAD-dependent dihydropyrimidine dehydrogenase PreA subunit|nr:MAG: 4Fe-4S ferredoxin [Spirochaetae bacterium HGW-Spirochaetae-1]
MNDEIYHRLRELLDTIPNGYPATEDGLEIKILKKIFTEEEADITLKLKLDFETPEAIAARTGMDTAYLTDKLQEMQNKGQIFGAKIGSVHLYKLLPFVFGIYEFQLNRLDRELAEMCEDYMRHIFGREFFTHNPPLLKVLPIEEDVPDRSSIEPYESLTAIIENAKAWAVGDCICKKEKAILGHRCDKPMEVCMGVAPIDNYFNDYFWGRPISKQEAFAILKKAEEAGLVHMTNNFKNGQFAICNCCACCCGVLRGMHELGSLNATAFSSYLAVVDESLCTACGMCLDRCQAGAITVDAEAVINERCIGCGLCVSTCPTGAITMKKREAAEILNVPKNEKEWMEQRENSRHGDHAYKNLFRTK